MSDIKKYFGDIAIESIFSDDRRHRFILRRKYSSSRYQLNDSKIVFILINPSYSDELLFDKTNRLASNIGVKDGYNEVVILNIFSLVTKDTKTLNKELQSANHQKNDLYIVEEIKKASRVILAWGIDDKYKDRIEDVKQLIKNNGIENDKVFSISYKDKNGKVYNPAHLSMYITDNPPNYEIKKFNLE